MRRFVRNETAQSLLEFAFVLPVFLLVITGLMDTARAVWEQNTLAYAAREGTRYAIVHGSAATLVVGPCSSCTNPTTNNLDDVVSTVRNAAVGVANVSVTIDYPDAGNDRNQRVTVDASAPFVPLPSQYLLGSLFQITLRGGSQLVIER